MTNLKTFIRITRAPFFTSTIVPVLVGTTVAWSQGFFHWGLFLLTLLGAVCINGGYDMSNDYFDHVSGNDDGNKEPTPFSGGSRVIQDGILAPGLVLLGALGFYLVGVLIGSYLAAMRGWPIMALGAVGLFLAFFHNAPPVKLYHLVPGLGELAVGIGCGPIVVLSSYYVQTQRFSAQALWASITVGLLITAVLYINEFPDLEADKAAGRKTLPIALGRRRAAWGYAALLVGAYAMMLAGVTLRIFSYALLLGLCTLPLAYRAVRGTLRFHSNTPMLIPVQATTIQLHLFTGLLVCLGFAAARVL